MPNVLRIRARRRRHDDQAVDCQRDECRMKSASSPYLDVADQNLGIIAVGESNKTTSRATGKRLCERRRSFVRRSKSNYSLVTDDMISESSARSADLRAGARSKLDGACRITSLAPLGRTTRIDCISKIELRVVKDDMARKGGRLDARVSCARRRPSSPRSASLRNLGNINST